MAVRPARDEGAIYFLTDVDTPKAEEIRRNQSVCLALSDNKSQKYVSVSGHAEMIDDRERVKKYWSVYDKAFWPDQNDPRIRVLRVTPESAEFWEGAGKMITAVKLVAADRLGRADKSRRERKGRFRSGRQARRLKLESRCERALLRIESRGQLIQLPFGFATVSRASSNVASRRGSTEIVTWRCSPGLRSIFSQPTRRSRRFAPSGPER